MSDWSGGPARRETRLRTSALVLVLAVLALSALLAVSVLQLLERAT